MNAVTEIETVLVPVDGSEESTEAVEYAVTIAAEYGASLHAIYVLGEAATRAIESGAVDDEDMAAEGQAYIEVVEDVARESHVPVSHSAAYGFSTQRKLVHPGNVVLDAADQIDADFLVVPREWGHGAGDVLEKAAEYVLLYASQPVLSV
jgi:nucleotide-binding universal stress UspA family protein